VPCAPHSSPWLILAFKVLLNVTTDVISVQNSYTMAESNNFIVYKKETLFAERQAKDAIFNDVMVMQR
jgi:hypothetical protein